VSAAAPGFEAAWQAVAEVDGWMTRGQGQALFAAAQRCPAHGRIVEIGSFRGRSTIVLALGAPDGAVVYAIDPHAGNDRGPEEISGFEDAASDDHDVFLANLAAAGVGDRVVHVRVFADAALSELDGPVDVLYVDGAHRYGPARADIRDWGSRVADGGTLLIHDSFSSVGVTAAIMRELAFGRRFRYVGRSRSLTTYRADLGRRRLGNTLGQLAQLPWFVKNVALKAALKLGLGSLLRRLGRSVPEWPY
jgi:predicted O-methyltransferase YrrM